MEAVETIEKMDEEIELKDNKINVLEKLYKKRSSWSHLSITITNTICVALQLLTVLFQVCYLPHDFLHFS